MMKVGSGYRSSGLLAAGICVLTSALIGSLFATGVTQPTGGPRDPFEQADLDFLGCYATARAATLAKLDPVIVVEMDSLVLIRHGERAEVKVIPRLYSQLKAVSHIALAVYVGLAPHGSSPIDHARLAQLRKLHTDVMAVVGALDHSDLSTDQKPRARALLERCATFLAGVLNSGKYNQAELLALTRAAGPVVLANCADAARAEIDAYHAQVSKWRASLTADEWSKLRILILGRQMPRKRNVATQYFEKLLGETNELRRIVYAEELMGEQQGLNLLASHQLDSELSEAFFQDPDRMEIDLLGNAASVYLDSFDFSR